MQNISIFRFNQKSLNLFDIKKPINQKEVWFTFASVIMTLTGNPYMQITAGPPDELEYKKIGFSKR